MARQQVSFARALALAAALAGCTKDLPYDGSFELPIAAAVLQPEVSGPFLEPIGFVANGHGGEITQLALKQGRFLTDDATASFLRTNPLATGGLRRLTSIAVTSGSRDEVTVWAGDATEGTLVRVPYLYDCALTPDRPECEADGGSGAPVEQGAYWEVTEEPGTAELTDVVVKKGYTATELWTITYDGASWIVDGSRSGRQSETALTGLPYSSELHRLGFTITDAQGRAEVGDRFVVRTENGLSEHDVGGTPLDVTASADLGRLAIIAHDRVADRPFVRWFDPVTRTVTGEVALPADAWPHRLAWAEDGSLLIADREHPAVWEVAVDDTAAIEHPTPWPTLDVAALDGADGIRRLYVAPIDSSGLWLFDRDTDLPIDVNAAVEGDQGLVFTSSVLGIEALRRPYQTPEYTDDGIRITARSVAVALSSNRIVYAHEDTGCLVQDNLGPRTQAVSGGYTTTGDYSSSFASTTVAVPVLELQGSSGRSVSVNACGGIANSEQWELVFDAIAQAWRVKGNLSGEQLGLAYENERYLSDDGAISFVIRSGATPTQEGWKISFAVDAGTAQATGDADGDGNPEIALGVTSDPTYFEYRVGLAGPIGDAEGEGWLLEDIRPLLLVPGASSNQVGRVDPQKQPPSAAVELEWQ